MESRSEVYVVSSESVETGKIIKTRIKEVEISNISIDIKDEDVISGLVFSVEVSGDEDEILLFEKKLLEIIDEH